MSLAVKSSQDNELQKKLARRRDLNGEGGGRAASCSENGSPKVAAGGNDEIAVSENASPNKRKPETELDKFLTRRRILNGEGKKTERLSQFGGAVGSNARAPGQKKKKTTIFNLEPRLLDEDLFRVEEKKMGNFQYALIVEDVKSELTLRGKTTESTINFILHLSNSIKKDISSQCNGLIIDSQDNMVPILLNVFVRAMVGPDRIHLSLFDSILERDCVNAISTVDKNIISNMKTIAETAHNWLVINHFIDLCPPVSGSMDVKIVMFGSYGTGKTALIERYVSGEFSGDTAPTIGVDVQSKTSILHGLECKAVIWDTAGQERYQAITESFLRGVDGVIVVYDVSNERTMPEEERMKLRKILDDSSIPTVLFGNKSDLLGSRDALLKYRKKSHFIGSARTGENVEEAFQFITAAALEKKMANVMTEYRQSVGGRASGDTVSLRKERDMSRAHQQSSSSGSGCCL